MFGEELVPRVADAIQQAMDASPEPGALDDLLLLELLVTDADDDLLRALGSRVRMLQAEVRAETAATAGVPDGELALPLAEDVVRFAATEAIELGGYGAPVGAIHVVLALFAFRGARSDDVLRRCGLDWRPLRSITRRLGLGF